MHILMEYASGGTLHRRIAQQEGALLPEEQIWEWFVQVRVCVRVGGGGVRGFKWCGGQVVRRGQVVRGAGGHGRVDHEASTPRRVLLCSRCKGQMSPCMARVV